MFTACKKNAEEDMAVEEIEIPGVEVSDETCAYEYSYSEQQDGSLLFTIQGKWQSNEAWKIEYDQDAIAEGKELEQSNKEVKFEFTPKEGKSGYSEYFIELYDTNTQKVTYTFVVPLMLSQDEKISVLNILYYAPTEEEVVEEVVEGDIPEADEEDEVSTENTMQEFYDVVGEIELPNDSEILEVCVKEYDDRKDGEKVGEMLFTYEDQEMVCVIAPDTPLSYFQNQMEEYAFETQSIDDVEVIVYDTEKSRYFMWKSKDDVRYVLSERMNGKGNGNGIKVVEMLIKSN